jgi:hypothetical protein
MPFLAPQKATGASTTPKIPQKAPSKIVYELSGNREDFLTFRII